MEGSSKNLMQEIKNPEKVTQVLSAFSNDFESLARHISIVKCAIKIRKPEQDIGYPLPPQIEMKADKKSVFTTPRGSLLEKYTTKLQNNNVYGMRAQTELKRRHNSLVVQNPTMQTQYQNHSVNQDITKDALNLSNNGTFTSNYDGRGT